jgi:putative transposase
MMTLVCCARSRLSSRKGRGSAIFERGVTVTRFARVVAVDVPHHVTQRGNARQFILDCEEDCKVYMELLRGSLKLHQLVLLGYCLMSNHVHLILIPSNADGLGRALKDTHGRYATYWNATRHSSGHVWQGRFYSCPLDEQHLWEALRYTELNPVRAGLVADAEQWDWSSARAHCLLRTDENLAMDLWQARWSAAEWRAFLVRGNTESGLAAIRQYTHTGRPLGGKEFIQALERATQRSLVAQRRGRPRKTSSDERQIMLRLDL